MDNQPLKVLIVDDEALIRDLLKRCVDWNDLGMEVVGEASTAREAMEIVEKQLPDIVFTDICMPLMDGIELSKNIGERYPQTKVIIITGYEDFDYAQRSIKAGVVDYILKPINDEEISRVAVKVKEMIEAERNKTIEYERLKKQLEETLPYLREKFLNELVQYKLDVLEIRNKFDFYGIKTKTDRFQVIIVEIIGGVTDRNEEERLLIRICSLNIIQQLLAEVEYVFVFMDTSQRLVIINNNEEIDLSTLAERFKISLINQLRHSFCIGVGNWYQGVCGIRSSYREACEALNYKVLIGKNEIIFYQDIHFYVSEEPHLSNEQVEMLGFYLKAGMGTQVSELLELIFKELAANLTISVDQIRVAGSNIIMKILNVLTVLGIETTGIFGKWRQPYEHVFNIDTLPEMKEYIFGISMKTIHLINLTYHKKANKLIQEVQDYLIKNYHDSDLSLTKVAKTFYVNPSYLSRIFKQETNQTFVEYLTQIRMEKARKIIKETDLKAYQVAERVGITDPHYFGLCFKKYTGISVNEFKKSQL